MAKAEPPSPYLKYDSRRRHRAHGGLVVLGAGLSALIGIGLGCIGCFVVGSERHLRSHALRVFPAQMPVNFQRQHSAVTVPKPPRNGRNVNPALNASRRKQVSQGMVRQPRTTDEPTGPRQRSLAPCHPANPNVWLRFLLPPQRFEQLAGA